MNNTLKSLVWLTSVAIAAFGIHFITGSNSWQNSSIRSEPSPTVTSGKITVTQDTGSLDKKLEGKALEKFWGECNAKDVKKRLSGCRILIDKAKLTDSARKAALSNLTYALMETGKFEEAAGYFKTLVTRFPKDLELAISQADNWQMLEKFSLAKTAYTDLIKRAPKHPELWVGRAWANFGLNQDKSALRDIKRAIKLEPKNPSHYLVRAQFYETSNKMKAAKKDYRQALRLNKKLEEAKHALKRLATKSNH